MFARSFQSSGQLRYPVEIVAPDCPTHPPPGAFFPTVQSPVQSVPPFEHADRGFFASTPALKTPEPGLPFVSATFDALFTPTRHAYLLYTQFR